MSSDVSQESTAPRKAAKRGRLIEYTWHGITAAIGLIIGAFIGLVVALFSGLMPFIC